MKRFLAISSLLLCVLQVAARPFFEKKAVPTVIEGQLEGYTFERYGATGLIYVNNELTGEDYPCVITIEQDGRFHARLPLQYPTMGYMNFGRGKHVSFYVEPGHKLSLTIKINEVTGDDSSGRVEYEGADAEIARQLNDYPVPVIGRYSDLTYGLENLQPLEYRDWLLGKMHKELARIDSLRRAVPLRPLAANLMSLQLRLMAGDGLFAYPSHKAGRNYLMHNVRIPEEYYNFLKEMPLNDPQAFAAYDFNSFVKAYKFSVFDYPLGGSRMYVLDIPAAVHCIRQGGDTIEGEKMRVLEELEKMPAVMNTFSYAYTTPITLRQMFPKGFAALKSGRDEKEVPDDTREAVDWDFMQIAQMDSLQHARYGVGRTLVGQLLLLHAFDMIEYEKERAYVLQRVCDLLPNATMRAALLNRTEMTEARLQGKAYPMPKDAVGTGVMQKILAPHRGKYVMVDFWGLFCGPCRAGIENSTELRTALKNSPDFTFVYVTSDEDSPSEKDYKAYVDKHMLGYPSHRLTRDEANYLRELFRFSGIPHYVVFNREGHVLNDNYIFYSDGLKADLKKWTAK